MKRAIEKAFRESAEVKLKFLQEYTDRIAQVTDLVLNAYRQGHKLLFFGNGGSATDASHLAAELVNRYRRDREGLPAIALTTDMSVITSIGNDISYNEIFSRQIQALGQKGDIAFAISTSGNSPNVLRGVEVAKQKGSRQSGLPEASAASW